MASVGDLCKLPFELYSDVPVFVILLESNEERYSHVHRDVLPKLQTCNIIKATNADKNEVEHFFREEKIDMGGAYTPMTLGKLACTISHIRTWKAIVAQHLKHAIVLEDDVAVRDGFTSFICKLISQIPINVDLVHLYVHAYRREWLRHAANTEKPHVSYIPVCGRSAYLLTRSCAEKLLLGFQTIDRNADFGYGAEPCGDIQIYEMAKRGKLNVCCAKESYVDNLGQLFRRYNGERFRSSIYTIAAPKTTKVPIDRKRSGRDQQSTLTEAEDAEEILGAVTKGGPSLITIEKEQS
jgi:GR25 family glycosyltransferase involved in LPS biosynthesis